MARKASGNTLIELAAVAWIMPLAAVMSVNVGVLVFGNWTNDAACRDAVRAAAQQNNKQDAQVAALNAVKPFATSSDNVSSPKISFTANDFEFETFADENGKPQMEKGPFVKVTTRLEAKLPAAIVYGDAGFTDKLVFKQSYTYPIINPDQTKGAAPQFDATEFHQEVLNGQASGTEGLLDNEATSNPI